MMSKLSGKVLKYGDSIDTDVIFPGKYLKIGTAETEEVAKHAMETLDREFPQKVKLAPILTVGKNFGCGSSREQAAVALKYCGVSVILASSFARIFFRNAISIGLPVMVCETIYSKVREGDELEVDLATGEIANISTGEILWGEKLTGFLLELLSSGGLIPHRKKELQASQRGN
jgi:3-isopropylmalate dehydratase small subunit